MAPATRRDYPDATHAYFEYAVCGRRAAMQDVTGRFEWAHDAAGRLTRYTQLDDEHSYYDCAAASALPQGWRAMAPKQRDAREREAIR